MFAGDLMRQDVDEVEVVSAKGRKTGKVGGAGETQLDIEKYNIKLREAKLNKELATIM
jgi:50S ribosomal subunit-associated GTPase HflX